MNHKWFWIGVGCGMGALLVGFRFWHYFCFWFSGSICDQPGLKP